MTEFINAVIAHQLKLDKKFIDEPESKSWPTEVKIIVNEDLHWGYFIKYIIQNKTVVIDITEAPHLVGYHYYVRGCIMSGEGIEKPVEKLSEIPINREDQTAREAFEQRLNTDIQTFTRLSTNLQLKERFRMEYIKGLKDLQQLKSNISALYFGLAAAEYIWPLLAASKYKWNLGIKTPRFGPPDTPDGILVRKSLSELVAENIKTRPNWMDEPSDPEDTDDNDDDEIPKNSSLSSSLSSVPSKRMRSTPDDSKSQTNKLIKRIRGKKNPNPISSSPLSSSSSSTTTAV